ncbi:MAG: transposase zinc-binding domain-containing protein [Pseudomonadota bacterium]
MYASRYGFWPTYVITVIYKYLDCGDLHMGFARVRCEECGHEIDDKNDGGKGRQEIH